MQNYNYRRPIGFKAWLENYASPEAPAAFMRFVATCVVIGALPGLVFGRWGDVATIAVVMLFLGKMAWNERKRR